MFCCWLDSLGYIINTTYSSVVVTMVSIWVLKTKQSSRAPPICRKHQPHRNNNNTDGGNEILLKEQGMHIPTEYEDPHISFTRSASIEKAIGLGLGLGLWFVPHYMGYRTTGILY